MTISGTLFSVILLTLLVESVKNLQTSTHSNFTLHQKDNFTVAFEGESNLKSTTSLKFASTSVIGLENDTKKTSVVPRKGATYDNISGTFEYLNETKAAKTSKHHSQELEKTLDYLNNTMLPNDMTSLLKPVPTIEHNGTMNLTLVKKSRKPMILSADDLTNSQHTVSNQQLELDNHHILEPNVLESKQSVPLAEITSKYTTSSNTSKHPGLIIPIVITIIVVPLFAVLGFMGLRRGREAWRNRHYRRMDFLLDGMYNE